MARTYAPFVCRPDGTVAVELSAMEAEAVRRVAREIVGVIEDKNDLTVRLFPPAYEDPARQKEYVDMTGDDLVKRKIAAARAVASSIDEGVLDKDSFRSVLDDETAHAWLGMLNDARLVLGTRLDITEDMDYEPLPPGHPDAAAHNMYLYLSGLEGHLVEALLEDRFGDDEGE